MLLLIIFMFYPLIDGVRISFTNWDGFSQHRNWIGFDNYRRMLSDPEIGRIIKNTFIYGVGSTVLQNVIGLAYALLLNHKLRLMGIARTIIYLPVIISPLIMGYIWYFFLQYHDGAINDIVLLFRDEPLNLLAVPNLNVWLITFVNTYQFLGISMVIFMAGLQVIPKDYYEAAGMDGAGAWTRFTRVTLPLLAPATTVSVVLNLIGGLKLFDVIRSLTDSGPGHATASLSSIMYKLYFGRQDAGYAAAIGILMILIISAVCLSALSYLRRREQVL